MERKRAAAATASEREDGPRRKRPLTLNESQLCQGDLAIHFASFLSMKDLVALGTSSLRARALGRAEGPLALSMYRLVSEAALLEPQGRSGAGRLLDWTSVATLSSWCLSSGGLALPPWLAAAFAARALADWKASGWGPFAPSSAAVGASVAQLAASPELATALRSCERTVRFKALSEDDNSSDEDDEEGGGGGDDDAELPLGEGESREDGIAIGPYDNYDGYGEVTQVAKAAIELRGWRVHFEATSVTYCDGGNFGVVVSGAVRAETEGLGRRTLLSWLEQSGDLDCGQSRFECDSAVAARLAEAWLPAGAAPPDALQCCWRLLAAPFRWLRLPHLYASQCVYTVSRDAFIRCAMNAMDPRAVIPRMEDEFEAPLFTARPVGPSDSDFAGASPAGLRLLLLQQQEAEDDTDLLMQAIPAHVRGGA